MKDRTIILVDDDHVTNFLNKEIIGIYDSSIPVISFEDPYKALDFLINEYKPDLQNTSILFLDINMPLITGWQFIEQLKEQKMAVVEHLKIYLLSSSIDQNDKKMATDHPYIIDMLSKPIDDLKLPLIFGDK